MDYSNYISKAINQALFTENMQKDFESVHGIIIPPGYRDFLRQMNGGESKKKRYTLPNHIPQIGYGYLTISRFNSVADLATHIEFIDERGELYGIKEEMGNGFFTKVILPIADGNAGETFIGIGAQDYNLGEVFWVILDWDVEGKPYQPVLLESDFGMFIARMTD